MSLISGHFKLAHPALVNVSLSAAMLKLAPWLISSLRGAVGTNSKPLSFQDMHPANAAREAKTNAIVRNEADCEKHEGGKLLTGLRGPTFKVRGLARLYAPGPLHRRVSPQFARTVCRHLQTRRVPYTGRRFAGCPLRESWRHDLRLAPSHLPLQTLPTHAMNS